MSGVVTCRGEPGDGISQGTGVKVKGNHHELDSAACVAPHPCNKEWTLLVASPAWLVLG